MSSTSVVAITSQRAGAMRGGWLTGNAPSSSSSWAARNPESLTHVNGMLTETLSFVTSVTVRLHSSSAMASMLCPRDVWGVRLLVVVLPGCHSSVPIRARNAGVYVLYVKYKTTLRDTQRPPIAAGCCCASVCLERKTMALRRGCFMAARAWRRSASRTHLVARAWGGRKDAFAPVQHVQARSVWATVVPMDDDAPAAASEDAVQGDSDGDDEVDPRATLEEQTKSDEELAKNHLYFELLVNYW